MFELILYFMAQIIFKGLISEAEIAEAKWAVCLFFIWTDIAKLLKKKQHPYSTAHFHGQYAFTSPPAHPELDSIAPV